MGDSCNCTFSGIFVGKYRKSICNIKAIFAGEFLDLVKLPFQSFFSCK